jgi:hypothetical protein
MRGGVRVGMTAVMRQTPRAVVHDDELRVNRIAAALGVLGRRFRRGHGFRIVAGGGSIGMRPRASIGEARIEHVELGQLAHRRMRPALHVGKNALAVDLAFPHLTRRQLRPRLPRRDHGGRIGRRGAPRGGGWALLRARGDRAEREYPAQDPREKIRFFGHAPFYDWRRGEGEAVRIISTHRRRARPLAQ